MTDAEIVEVGEGCGHRGPETGDHLRGLLPQPGEIAPSHAPQDEAVRRIGPFYPDQLHHTRMGDCLQDRSLPSESPPLLGRIRLLVNQACVRITRHLHPEENSCITLTIQQNYLKIEKMMVRTAIAFTDSVALCTGS
jgi:hypothetical protein